MGRSAEGIVSLLERCTLHKEMKKKKSANWILGAHRSKWPWSAFRFSLLSTTLNTKPFVALELKMTTGGAIYYGYVLNIKLVVLWNCNSHPACDIHIQIANRFNLQNFNCNNARFSWNILALFFGRIVHPLQLL